MIIVDDDASFWTSIVPTTHARLFSRHVGSRSTQLHQPQYCKMQVESSNLSGLYIAHSQPSIGLTPTIIFVSMAGRVIYYFCFIPPGEKKIGQCTGMVPYFAHTYIHPCALIFLETLI